MQILIAQTVLSNGGRARDLRASVCAWEDRRIDYRARLAAHATAGRASGFDRDIAFIEQCFTWIDPYQVDDRGIAQYIEHVRYLTKALGIKIHLFDPWNSHDYAMGVGEAEHLYIRRVLTLLTALSKELGVLIIVVAHLTKGSSAEAGRIKPFKVSEAAGSKDFGARAEAGICVARSTYLSAVIDGDIADPLISESDITVARAKGIFRGGDHMICVIDKLKVEGTGPNEMGQRGAYAFSLDKRDNQLIIDSPATHILRKLWRL